MCLHHPQQPVDLIACVISTSHFKADLWRMAGGWSRFLINGLLRLSAHTPGRACLFLVQLMRILVDHCSEMPPKAIYLEHRAFSYAVKVLVMHFSQFGNTFLNLEPWLSFAVCLPLFPHIRSLPPPTGKGRVVPKHRALAPGWVPVSICKTGPANSPCRGVEMMWRKAVSNMPRMCLEHAVVGPGHT